MRFYILQDFRKIQLVDRGIGIIMALLEIWNLSFGAQHLLVVCNKPYCFQLSLDFTAYSGIIARIQAQVHRLIFENLATIWKFDAETWVQ